MKLFEPNYFRKFHCIATACPDSCCKEWDVLVDEGSAALYRSLEGPLGDRLRQVLQVDEDGNIVLDPFYSTESYSKDNIEQRKTAKEIKQHQKDAKIIPFKKKAGH